MKAKLSLLTGAAIGYVLGARAGHQSYERIKGRATQAWASDPVQSTVDTAKEAVIAKAPMIAEKVNEAAKFTSSKFKNKDSGEELTEPVEIGRDATVYADVSGFGNAPGSLL